MLMTFTSPELTTAAELAHRSDLPFACRHLEPDGQSAEESRATFNLRFSRSSRLLHFVAHHILHCLEEAEVAVKNCHRTASRNPPSFSNDGAFKSWLVRILIDEATLLLRDRQSESTAA
jgi:DNA-directed RNA polymerase specialized sigma24 family protein